MDVLRKGKEAEREKAPGRLSSCLGPHRCFRFLCGLFQLLERLPRELAADDMSDGGMMFLVYYS